MSSTLNGSVKDHASHSEGNLNEGNSVDQLFSKGCPEVCASFVHLQMSFYCWKIVLILMGLQVEQPQRQEAMNVADQLISTIVDLSAKYGELNTTEKKGPKHCNWSL